MLHLYFSRYNELTIKNSFDKISRNLPDRLVKDSSRFTRAEDRFCTLLGKYLLKNALIESHQKDTLMDIKVTKYGRPYISDAFDFNISHSDGVVACAFNGLSMIGIDVEKRRSVNIEPFNKYFKNEWSEIKQSKDPEGTLLKLWTCKEAVMKADGRGVHETMNQMILKDHIAIVDEKQYYVQQINLGDDSYFVHVASCAPIRDFVIHHVII